MKVTSHNANILLFDKIESINSEDHHNWRCIQLAFSDKKGRYSASLRAHFVVKTIVSTLEGMEGNIYLCEDGDIFILFQGIAKPVITKLSAHFADLVPDQEEGKAGELFTIFDLSKGWKNFYGICYDKYHLAMRGRREKNKAAIRGNTALRKVNTRALVHA
jgi:hypothetical protein